LNSVETRVISVSSWNPLARSEYTVLRIYLLRNVYSFDLSLESSTYLFKIELIEVKISRALSTIISSTGAMTHHESANDRRYESDLSS